MKQISRFYIARLHLQEAFGFHQQVMSFLERLPDADMPDSSLAVLREKKKSYRAALQVLDDEIGGDDRPFGLLAPQEADKLRGLAWRGLRDFIRAMGACPDPQVAAAARNAREVLDKYADPRRKPYLQESGILHTLIGDLREALEAGRFAGLGIELWLDDLEAKENLFLEALDEQNKWKSTWRKGAVQQARQALDAAYRSLVEVVNWLARLHPELNFDCFIDPVSVLVAEEKEVLKGRATRRENKATPDEADKK